ncbi:hypothetical protein A9K55_003662 [Cordyceps militaris]|uniref:HNH nuclease domain-containing protein n=1 Tax=Cordyceps militaris TaxID=73501 RepID=A0A2H4S8A9_CORMI|nr:hypothetical protein A9K55_003662 [Cordyceps militaris]
MSAAVTASMRAVGWNVRFTIGPDSYPLAFAGVYQNPRKPTIKFADVCAELALCFEFKTLDGERGIHENNAGDKGDKGNTGGPNSWEKIAFALTEKPDATNEADQVEYPSWITEETLDELVPGVLSIDSQQQRIVKYHIVRHDHCRLPADSSLKDHLQAKCAQHLADPDRRRHPAYLPHNKMPSDPRLNIMPLRRKAKARSQSPPKRTASGATSPGKPTDDADGEDNNMIAPANTDIDLDEARRVENEFRMACINWSSCCAISGDGRPWCFGQPIGPGIQACHIVPQQHYHLYPVKNSTTLASEGDRAIEDSPRGLREAWEHTWSPANGILLMKHIHDFFDSRLVSIHPLTLLVRVFVPYQALEPFHGRKAQVSPAVDRNALRHHYDMCCIENMAASRRNLLTSLVTSGKSTSTTSFINTSGGGTPFSGGTGLPMTPSLGRTPTQTAMRPAGDPSKRQRTIRDGSDKGQSTNEVEIWQEDVDSPQRKRRRMEDAYRFDSYIMPHNHRQFLADVNWELWKLKAGS